MLDDEDLFLRIIAGLDDGGVLQQVVLIGSWALRVYQTHFDNNPEVPILTTTDVDFLVPNPPRLELSTVAQPLEYVSLAYDRSMIVRHRGHDVRVPQPEAFVVLKLLVVPTRMPDSGLCYHICVDCDVKLW